ncbi:protein kinase [Archangium violaceum]|uniref:serine/threonine-protein kinase n=1 Tax=Archangium violaceum TaxID=83451 RepID=UPI00194FA630|nr:serine/threonine-protein kinase [Archangium violaceum]QRO00448.1 protein kinase [Archangium violaceum]
MDNDSTEPTVPHKVQPQFLLQGLVIAGRFTLEALAGRGGMGTVYRATDSHSGRPVAIKLLHAVTSPEVAYRFNREALLLSELSHPGIVSYVHHGTSEAGQPYLAMEWLEGEDLSKRLARQPLTLPESLRLLRCVAEALATAHAQGIVHRDIKPSNLFLRGGRPQDAVLLDFGLARYTTRSLVAVTMSNTVLGTAGYMAPEQASSQPEISPAADIFSLGCVLYECLTGRPPFDASHFAVALAKILYAEPAPLNTLRADLPPDLQVLVDRMLVKDPRRRLPDVASLLEALTVLESVPELVPPRASKQSRSPGLGDAEQKLVSVLLVSFEPMRGGESGGHLTQGFALRDSLRPALAPYGAQVELLADGSLVVSLVPERGTATDQVALAARCALTLKERWPETTVVLVTGRGVFNERLPVGDALDRAGRLLRQLERMPTAAFVVMDEVTAGLLGSGFQLSRSSEDFFLLQGEQSWTDESRPLLGRPTACVGREQELALLDFTLTACIEEQAARAVLVTAPPGMGKSRLRHEFLRRIERRESRPLVLLGRGDPMGAGASHGLLGQALRRLCGLVEGESLEARRGRLFQRVTQHLPEDESQDVVEFLGELCAIPFPEEDSPRLRAARGDPRLMSTQLGRALTAFLKAECTHQPVLLMLEDLHWSDALTIKLVDEVLRELAEHSFMVLALARPEVKELFPGLWSRRLQELQLNGLSRKASGRLVREVLGPRMTDSVVQRVVEQADGNALFLEELIRMVAEGRGEAPPETVLAVLQARLMRMEPGMRQVLLAASFFGRTFWSGGVRALLGRQGEDESLEMHLRQLVRQEVIEPQPSGRFPGLDEYRFRHGLVRDAAYGLVPDNHRAMGHRLVAAWLERMGEPDPLVLATHYQLGQQLDHAALFYARAAEQLFERHDLQGTMRCVDEALACGVSGEPLVRLRALQSVVCFWRDEFAKLLELGGPVLEGLKAGSPLWCRLVSGLIIANAHDGRHDQVARLSELLLRTNPEPEAVAPYVESIALMGAAAIWSGARQKVEVLLGRLLEVGPEVMARDAVVRGWMGFLKSHLLYLLEARPWQAFLVSEQGWRDFRDIGSEREVILQQALSGAMLVSLGDIPGAVERLRAAVAVIQGKELHLVGTHVQLYLLQSLASSPEPAHRQEALLLAREWVTHTLVIERTNSENSFSFRRGMSCAMLAHVMAGNGELREAESHARMACAQLAPFPAYLIFARTTLASVLLAQGRVAEARAVAALGVRELEQMGSEGEYAVSMYLALVEACFAGGDIGAGEAALRKAVRCVRARADDIPEPATRERFLRRVPQNARILELARQRWGEAVA